MIRCPGCKRDTSVIEFLDELTEYSAKLYLATFSCSVCQARTEARVISGEVQIGYVYAAGSPHFVPVVKHEIEGLVCSSSPERLQVALGEREWSIVDPRA